MVSDGLTSRATDLARRLAAADSEGMAWRLLCLFVLTIPFSIALAQTVLTLAFVAGIRHAWRSGGRPKTPLDAPILFFVATAVLGALLGLDVGQSLWGLRTYLQIFIIYLVAAHVRDEERATTLVACFLGGMVVTSFHTVFNTLSPWKMPNFLPGQMTESGQLLFAIGLSAALWLHRALWPRLLPWTLALHTFALIANLKRGVWLGALAMIVVIGLIRSRRLILAATTVLVATVLLIAPVRERIEHTTRDLLLPGNRYDIWAASVDVIQRFPMGVGRKNGTILRDYPNIPQNHKHAHNNLLQITLEDGFLGLAAFVWWMGAFGLISWRTWRRLPPHAPLLRSLAVAVFATFVGFHVAGLVEYNFGDTEVLEIFFVMMGLGLFLADASLAATPAEADAPRLRRSV